MKKFSIIIFALLLSFSSLAQQEAQFTQYMYNPGSINPGYAGSEEVFNITGLHRSQWVGLDGAPVTQVLSLSSPVGKNVGMGLSIINDKIGPSSEVNASVDFAYTLLLDEVTKLAFGIKASAHWLDIDFEALEGGGVFDPKFGTNVENRFSPNVGVGAYLYGERYYLGLSAPRMLESRHYKEEDGTESFLATEKLHGYLMGGYVFDLSQNLKLKPAFLLKSVSGAPLQVDLSSSFLFHERFTLGASYRWSSAVSALAGFQITDSMFLGYAYDAETTALRKYNSGSHELVLSFDLSLKPKKAKKDPEPEVAARFF